MHLQHAAAPRSSTPYASARLHNQGQKTLNGYENVQPGFLSKTAFQTACVPPRSCQTVQGQLSDLHNFLFLFLLNFSFSLFSVSFYPSHGLDAEVHFVNMTVFTRGGLHSSFWIVDRKHIYIGSADMDWRSLSKVKAHINIWFAGVFKE